MMNPYGRFDKTHDFDPRYDFLSRTDEQLDEPAEADVPSPYDWQGTEDMPDAQIEAIRTDALMRAQAAIALKRLRIQEAADVEELEAPTISVHTVVVPFVRPINPGDQPIAAVPQRVVPPRRSFG